MNTMETVVRARIDQAIKHDAEEVLSSMGLSMSSFLRMTLIRVAKEKAIPFDIKVPNEVTVRAMKEAQMLIAEKKARNISAEELFNELDEK